MFTGNKMDQKEYSRFQWLPGGRKEEVAQDLLKRRPEVIIESAVKGMLPKNRLGRKMYKKLFVYRHSIRMLHNSLKNLNSNYIPKKHNGKAKKRSWSS